MGNRLQRLTLAFFLLMMTLEISHCASDNVTQEPSIVVNESHSFIWPLKKFRRVSREFGSGHEGIDLSAPQGTNIYAAQSGRVVYAGHAFHGYGNMILIDHGGGLASIYGHCYKMNVRSGDYVEQNALIGLVGKTGRASAPHLHFEVRLRKVPVDPSGYLPHGYLSRRNS